MRLFTHWFDYEDSWGYVSRLNWALYNAFPPPATLESYGRDVHDTISTKESIANIYLSNPIAWPAAATWTMPAQNSTTNSTLCSASGSSPSHTTAVSEFVKCSYHRILRRDATSGEVTAGVATANGSGRHVLIRDLAMTQEAKDIWRSWVTMTAAYARVLRRPVVPLGPEFDYWLSYLGTTPTDSLEEQMYEQFYRSAEYRSRFCATTSGACI